jgi:hypothetical protein
MIINILPEASIAHMVWCRQVLMATNHLHRAVSDLRTRVRDLKSALSDLHLVRMGSPHPLMTSPDDGDDVDEEDDLTRSLASLRLQSDTSTLATAGDRTIRYYGYTSGGLDRSAQVRVFLTHPALDELIYSIASTIDCSPNTRSATWYRS